MVWDPSPTQHLLRLLILSLPLHYSCPHMPPSPVLTMTLYPLSVQFCVIVLARNTSGPSFSSFPLKLYHPIKSSKSPPHALGAPLQMSSL